MKQRTWNLLCALAFAVWIAIVYSNDQPPKSWQAQGAHPAHPGVRK